MQIMQSRRDFLTSLSAAGAVSILGARQSRADLLLKIMSWNIAEGSLTGAMSYNATIPGIAREIGRKSPDIVLLNEVKHWDIAIGGWIGSGMRQTIRIAELTGLPHYQWGNSVQMGWTGHKVNAVLSRYPLGTSHNHPIMHWTTVRTGPVGTGRAYPVEKETNYAIFQTSFVLDNRIHHVFSTRFNAHHPGENVAAHQQAIRLVQSLDPTHSVIFGGDFNANRTDDPQNPQFKNLESHRAFLDFERSSGLANAFDPVQYSERNTAIDHVFYRGPYRVVSVSVEGFDGWKSRGEGDLSEHPWVYVELSQPTAAPSITTIPAVPPRGAGSIP